MKRTIHFLLVSIAAAAFCSCVDDESRSGLDEGYADGPAPGEQETTLFPGPCSVYHDSDDDGTWDTIDNYTYDQWGNVSCREEDWGADGYIDTESCWVYDAEGKLLSWESHSSEDDSSNSGNNTYGPNGELLIKKSYHSGQEVLITRTTTYQYADGYVIDVLGCESVDEFFGDPTETCSHATYENDEHGNPLVEELDEGNDGTIEERSVMSYEYDADGNMTLMELDGHDEELADGVVDLRYTWTYDDAGNVLTEESDGSYYGEAADGVIDARTVNTYDERSNMTSTIRYYYSEDAPPYAQHWKYDSNSNNVITEVDSNGDGRPEVVTVNLFDPRNLLIMSIMDSGEDDGPADGRPERITLNSYDHAGNPLRTQLTMYDNSTSGDEAPAGPVTRVWENDYECWGQ